MIDDEQPERKKKIKHCTKHAEITRRFKKSRRLFLRNSRSGNRARTRRCNVEARWSNHQPFNLFSVRPTAAPVHLSRGGTSTRCSLNRIAFARVIGLPLLGYRLLSFPSFPCEVIRISRQMIFFFIASRSCFTVSNVARHGNTRIRQSYVWSRVRTDWKTGFFIFFLELESSNFVLSLNFFCIFVSFSNNNK